MVECLLRILAQIEQNNLLHTIDYIVSNMAKPIASKDAIIIESLCCELKLAQYSDLKQNIQAYYILDYKIYEGEMDRLYLDLLTKICEGETDLLQIQIRIGKIVSTCLRVHSNK